MPKVLKTSNHAKTWLSLRQNDISWFEVKLKMISNHTTQSLRVAYFPSKVCISRVEVHLIDTSNHSFHCTVRWVIISLDLWAVIPSGHASGRARVYSSSVRWPLSTYIRGLGVRQWYKNKTSTPQGKCQEKEIEGQRDNKQIQNVNHDWPNDKNSMVWTHPQRP